MPCGNVVFLFDVDNALLGRRGHKLADSRDKRSFTLPATGTVRFMQPRIAPERRAFTA